MNMRPKPFRLFSRAAAVLLLSVLTTMTAWADTETVSYIDADGNAQTATVPTTAYRLRPVALVTVAKE